jgi:ABC-type lipoprotein release transport system permease subunit
MAAVWMRARSQLRHHWAATVGLAVVVGLAGGIVLAAVAAAGRTDAAFPAFVEAARGSEAAMFGSDWGDPEGAVPLRDWAAAQPHVVDAARSTAVILQVEHPRMPRALRRHLGWLQLDPGYPMAGHPLVVHGRMPAPRAALEVAIDEELAERTGIGVGDELPIGLFTAAQFDEAGEGASVTPAGPHATMRVTGIVRQPFDLVPVHRDQSNIYVDSSDLYLTSGFWDRFGPDLSTYGYGVDVRFDSPAAVAGFKASAKRHFGAKASFDTPGFGGGESSIASVRQTVSLQVKAILFFAGLTTVAALVLLGQTLGRQIRLETDDAAILRSVGFSRREVVLSVLLRSAVIGVAGAALAVVIAIALSPLAPVGLARRSSLSHPVWVDAAVLGIGAPVVFLFVVLASVPSSWRVVRPDPVRVRRPSALAAAVSAASAPPPVTTGVELALRPGSGRGAVPVRTALVTATISMMALTAAATYASSAAGVTGHPDRYGVTWDVSVGNFASPGAAAAGARVLARTDGVAGWSGITTNAVSVDGHALPGVLLRRDRGDVGPLVTEGRLPVAPHEVALGRGSMRSLHLHVGDRVHVTADGLEGAVPATVVGTVVLNTAGVDSSVTPGDGALFDDSIVTGGFHASADDAPPQVFVVRFAPGADRAATMRALEQAFPSSTVRPLTPADVDRLAQVAALPWLLGGVIGFLGAAATAHAVLSAVRRRRGELAVLKTVGFVRRQVSATIAAQASTFAAVAIVVGVPLGIVTGRVAWRAVAAGIGLDPVVVVPLALVVAIVFGTLLAVNVIAAIPGVMARRIRPAVALRAE